MAENSGILVFGEVADDGLSGTSKELLGKASEMAGTLGESVVGVVAGDWRQGRSRRDGRSWGRQGLLRRGRRTGHL